MTALGLPASLTVTPTPIGALCVRTDALVLCVLPDATRVEHLVRVLRDAHPQILTAEGGFLDADAALRFDALVGAVWPQRHWSADEYGHAAYVAGECGDPRRSAAFCRDFLGVTHRYDPVFLQQLEARFAIGWHAARRRSSTLVPVESSPHPVSTHP